MRFCCLELTAGRLLSLRNFLHDDRTRDAHPLHIVEGDRRLALRPVANGAEAGPPV